MEYIIRTFFDSFINGIKKIFSDNSMIKAFFSYNKAHKVNILHITIILVVFSVVSLLNIKKRRKTERKLIENTEKLSNVCEEYKYIQEKNEFLFYYDGLTGLPNRTLTLEILNKKLMEAQYYNKRGAVFQFDIDDFKVVNATLGHDYGDKLLQAIVKRLEKTLDKNKTILCKVSGEEFLVILYDIEDIYITTEIAEKLVNSFYQPFYLDGNEIFLTISMGISVFSNACEDANKILKNVNTAMTKSKDIGKNKYLFYNVNMYYDILRKNELVNLLRKSIQNSELKIVFQPQVRLRDSKIVSTEVLLRWNNLNYGIVSPEEFIPLAEQTALIVPIGKWVLREACLKNKQWIDKGYPPKIICVNVSVVQLQQENFIKDIKDILEYTKLPSKYLEIEITESVLMKSLDDNLEVLNTIKGMGINITLDDFGKGYSSLSYLKKLPINKLKLDKFFIDELTYDESCKDIVYGVIELTHKMGISIIAEGVEEKEQLEILKKMNCDEVQGYYISKPISDEEFEKKFC